MEKEHPWTIFLAFNFLTLLHIDTGRKGRENEKEKKDSALEIEQTLWMNVGRISNLER